MNEKKYESGNFVKDIKLPTPLSQIKVNYRLVSI